MILNFYINLKEHEKRVVLMVRERTLNVCLNNAFFLFQGQLNSAEVGPT